MFSYLHHLWYDPISADEKFNATILLGLPACFIVLIILFICQWLQDRYE